MKALITGITGQDGAWLSQILLHQGYEVYGATRRTSDRSLSRLKSLNLENHIRLVEMDLLDYSNILQVIKDIQPDEVYNLAAQSFVATSFLQPISTFHINAIGPLYLLDILKTHKPDTKFYQASTSEMFGLVKETPQKETTPFHPRSPYGVAKLAAHWATVNYRESYGMFCCCGILFNHESHLRGLEFVTRKIVHHIINSYEPLKLGNLDSVRDWGFAKEYCQGMFQMMQQQKPDDYVLATGKAATVRQFVELAYRVIDLKIEWHGSGAEEVGTDHKGRVLVQVDPDLYRPAEVNLLLGDASKAKRDFGWEPKTNLEQLVKIMIDGEDTNDYT